MNAEKIAWQGFFYIMYTASRPLYVVKSPWEKHVTKTQYNKEREKKEQRRNNAQSLWAFQMH